MKNGWNTAAIVLLLLAMVSGYANFKYLSKGGDSPNDPRNRPAFVAGLFAPAALLFVSGVFCGAMGARKPKS